ncbi:MAG: tRNA (N6-threonylcarbamoyladenosine(37)-N6)-methyltransferase TrmO [Methanomicrobiales archaeon]|nr:tRNA (N6-threonylcarbamoyladenosine(37)-N6)-methyltransferase TrmO [Methanomicrobiales archaeon]
MEVCYSFIGIIHSPFTGQPETPIQSVYSSAEGTIEIFPEYTDGLQEIEGFSHLILLYHFHVEGPLRLRVAPFLDHENERGIFSTRHHDRPNRIGLSIVELLSVEETTLSIRGIDVLDGTPLLDIKPYVLRFDHRDHVRSGWIDRADREREISLFTPEYLTRKREPGKE